MHEFFTHFIEVIIPVLVALIASNGFWAYTQNKRDKKGLQTELLIGLAHDRLVFLGTRYIERGWITHDEYENLYNYLFKPYEQLGGNGSAKRIMDEVTKLPLHPNTKIVQGEITNENFK